jgi:CelD/BcsL family acetyltransferase involved in cellulose biosynthesis
LTLEIIEDFRRLVEIEPEWSSFVQRIDSSTPFQLPDWLLTWWRHFGSGQLHVLVFRNADRIAGIVPCFLHEWNSRRQMTLIGSGISDYLEPPIAKEYCSAIVDQVQTHLQADRNWDICDWQDLSLDTPLKRLASRIVDDTGSYVIPLTGSFEQFLRACSKDLRRNVRRYRHKAEARGSLEFEIFTEATVEVMQALIRLHTARWQKHGQPGMIEANRTADFLQDVGCNFARKGMLRIFSLRFEKGIAAVILAFEYANRLFCYLSAFDPQYEALGLGRILIHDSVHYSFERGYEAWDFLRGDEPYKKWWGAHWIPKCRLIVTRRD